ncbi:MAG: trypsin-like peptidase domain-containing protein [Actinomycetota bacterium]
MASALVIAGVVGGLVGAATHDDQPPIVINRTQARPVQSAEPAVAQIQPANVDPVAVGATVIPSIVTVEVGAASGGSFVQAGSGSGVVLDRDGHIITNHHVAEGGGTARVVLSDGRIYDADVIGSDPLTDLAVLRISASDLEPIALGTTEGLTVGSPTIAVGSPLGLDGGPSLSVGVVSALGREVQTGPDTVLYGMIQTDAPITSGSSGGSLVNSDGALIGITTAVGVSNIGVEGIGFATPVEVVERVTAEIITTGSASHALLGISGTTEYEPTDDGGIAPVGVLVRSVIPGSPAADAGISSGNVITAIDGVHIATMDALITELRRTGTGRALVVSIDGAAEILVTPATA